MPLVRGISTPHHPTIAQEPLRAIDPAVAKLNNAFVLGVTAGEVAKFDNTGTTGDAAMDAALTGS
jgi:hypothetical protein